jgi:ATP-binding cassette subfamily B protein
MKNNFDKKSLSLYFRVTKFVWDWDKPYLFIALFDAVLMPFLNLYLAWITALFINELVAGEIKTFADPAILKILIAYILIPVFTSSFQYLQSYYQNRFYLFGQQKLELMLMNKKKDLDIQLLENTKFNDLLEKVNSNFQRVVWSAYYLFYVIASFISLLVAIFALGFYNWYFVVTMIIAVFPVLLLEIKFGRSQWGIWDAEAEERRKYNEFGRPFDKANSLIELKIAQNGNYFMNLVGGILQNFNLKVNQNQKTKTKREILANFFMYFLTSIIILLLINDVIKGIILVGTFSFMIGRIFAVKNEASLLFSQLGIYVGEKRFIQDLFEFLDTPKILQNGTQKLNLETPTIEFKNVSFKYPEETTSNSSLIKEESKLILKNINVKINKGEKVAIVGVNGAGKTTFTKLLLRFYDVTGGEVLIDGKNIKDVDINSYYEKVAYLPQDYARYRLTIKEAIMVSKLSEKTLSFGEAKHEAVHVSSDSEWERVVLAAKKAGAYEFIMGLEKGFDTQLGKEFEGGVEPSVGQWQKLALARLFYKDPQIYVLDEPTASIDAIAELEIFNQLENLGKDKTVILISHRFNTVKNADKIIIIEHGQIQEVGNHEELMQKENGIYKNLFESQKESYE